MFAMLGVEIKPGLMITVYTDITYKLIRSLRYRWKQQFYSCEFHCGRLVVNRKIDCHAVDSCRLVTSRCHSMHVQWKLKEYQVASKIGNVDISLWSSWTMDDQWMLRLRLCRLNQLQWTRWIVYSSWSSSFHSNIHHKLFWGWGAKPSM